jgi:hypothetical protein
MYLKDSTRSSNSQTYIRQVHSYEDFKYWSKENSTLFCTKRDPKSIIAALEKYAFKNTNVVLMDQTDIIRCKDNITFIAAELHKRNLALAMYVDINSNYKSLFKDNFSGIQTEFINSTFKDFSFINDWVDYLVIDKGMEYLSYEERRVVQTEMRKIFTKPFIGFRFPNNIVADQNGKHPNRPDKDFSLFEPRDDDGDFIITSIQVESFKRTLIFTENPNIQVEKINGVFL